MIKQTYEKGFYRQRKINREGFKTFSAFKYYFFINRVFTVVFNYYLTYLVLELVSLLLLTSSTYNYLFK